MDFSEVRVVLLVAPIFILGRFRSGTTMFWNFLRASSRYTGYCEPCHEHLLHHVRSNPLAVDPSHTGVDDYWAEYRRLEHVELEVRWRPWFGHERFLLGTGDGAHDLFDFLQYLARESSQRPVMKFVRCDFRASWLRANFPDSLIIHVLRNPRSCWTSSVGRGSGREDDHVPPHPKWGSFVSYSDAMADDIGLPRTRHPYQRFYALWRLSQAAVGAVADMTWQYEDAVSSFPAWAEMNLLATGLLDASPKVEIRTDSLQAEFHDACWYGEQEAEVDAAIEREGWEEAILSARTIHGSDEPTTSVAPLALPSDSNP